MAWTTLPRSHTGYCPTDSFHPMGRLSSARQGGHDRAIPAVLAFAAAIMVVACGKAPPPRGGQSERLSQVTASVNEAGPVIVVSLHADAQQPFPKTEFTGHLLLNAGSN